MFMPRRRGRNEEGIVMRNHGFGARKLIFGAALGLAVAAGLAACGSSTTKSNPAGGANPAPAHTTPTTQSPGGGVSY
jgi:hypothetical protein